jgi:hypothetical protein
MSKNKSWDTNDLYYLATNISGMVIDNKVTKSRNSSDMLILYGPPCKNLIEADGYVGFRTRKVLSELHFDILDRTKIHSSYISDALQRVNKLNPWNNEEIDFDLVVASDGLLPNNLDEETTESLKLMFSKLIEIFKRIIKKDIGENKDKTCVYIYLSQYGYDFAVSHKEMFKDYSKVSIVETDRAIAIFE